MLAYRAVRYFQFKIRMIRKEKDERWNRKIEKRKISLVKLKQNFLSGCLSIIVAR